MDHQLLFVPMQALENLILDHHPDHLHQADLFHQWEIKKAHQDQVLTSLILLHLEKQEMDRSPQHIRITLQNQVQDLEVPLTLHPEVLVQHRGIIHVLDLDQIQ